jgi:CheY-like chemotaxis protein
MADNRSHEIHRFSKYSLIWIAFIFGWVYWILESIRDVFIYDKGPLVERLFFPDMMSFWMRILVMCILLLFGAFAQSLWERFENGQTSYQNIINRIGLEWFGIGFALIYWITESVRDVVVFQKGNFLSMVIHPDPMGFWMRFQGICILILFAFYAKKLIQDHQNTLKALYESHQRIVKLNRIHKTFHTVVTNDLEQSITTMKETASQWLNDETDEYSDDHKGHLSLVLNSLDRLINLFKDLLALSRLEKGEIILKRAHLDLCSVVQNVLKGFEKSASKNGFALELILPVKPVYMYADQEKLYQIFYNLIGLVSRNMVENGKIKVSLKDKPSSVNCRIEAAGVKADDLDLNHHIKNMSEDEDLSENVNLGIRVTKRLIEIHGGKIVTYISSYSKAEFQIHIDKKPFPRILIVDDEQKVVDVISNLLISEHYQVDTAFYGEEALEKALMKPFDLILLDMNLPYMGGYEVIGRLKLDQRTSQIPILIISGYDVDEKKLEEVNKHSVIPNLIKPFKMIELRDKVREMLTESV